MIDQKTTSKNKNRWKAKIILWTTIIGTAGFIALIWFSFKSGLLKDPEKMQNFFRGLGSWAPICFTLYQLIQTVIPLIPGGISIGVGMMMFGVWSGFILSIIPIIIGSIINFWLARRFGWSIIESVTSEKEYKIAKSWIQIDKHKFKDKWVFKPFKWILPEKNFQKIMDWLLKEDRFVESLVSIVMLVPGFPADLLCFVFGLMKIKLKRFVIILLICKPINTLFYGWIFWASVNGFFHLV